MDEYTIWYMMGVMTMLSDEQYKAAAAALTTFADVVSEDDAFRSFIRKLIEITSNKRKQLLP